MSNTNTTNDQKKTIENKATEKKTRAKKKQVNVDLSTLVPCINNINGQLIYKSKVTHNTFEWSHFGDAHYISVGELVNMKGSNPAFFENRWIIIEDQDVVEFLFVSHYYKDVVDEDDFETFFMMDIDEMERFLDRLSIYERANLIELIREKYENKEFDSIRKIQFIEKKYNISITE